jgi:hypothetical protein
VCDKRCCFVCYDCGTDSTGVNWDEKYRQYLIGAQHLGVKEYSTQSKKARGTTSRKRYPPQELNPVKGAPPAIRLGVADGALDVRLSNAKDEIQLHNHGSKCHSSTCTRASRIE